MQAQKKLLAATLGGAFAATLAAVPVAQAAQNPFAITPLASGYLVADADAKMQDGKCGTGKCGANKKKAADKAKDGNCSAEMKAKDGSCSAEMKAKDGNCGAEMKDKEGSCGGNKS